MRQLIGMFILLVIHPVESQNLFSDEDNHMDLTPKQLQILRNLQNKNRGSEIETVMINQTMFDQNTFNLNINKQAIYQVQGQSIASGDNEVRRWVGSLSENADDVSFVINDNNVTGIIHQADQVYSVVPLGGGVHALITKNLKDLPPEHPEEFNQQMTPTKEADNEPLQAPEPPDETMDLPPGALNDPQEATVLVLYTKKVADHSADPSAFAQLAVDLSNESFKKHHINDSLRMIKALQVDYQEQGGISGDLRNLVGKADGHMDDIHRLRNQLKADMVVLLTDSRNACGKAEKIKATAETAFAVVYHDCATSYMSFAHEVGHLYGARHNIEKDPNNSPYPYGHGFYPSDYKHRSIMSYDCPIPCKRIPRWSDPNAVIAEEPFGNRHQSNNALVIKKNFQNISRFR